MFKGHQGGTVLPVPLETPGYVFGDETMPAVSASAFRRADSGVVTLSLVNADPHRLSALECTVNGWTSTSVQGRLLTADAMNAHNTFAAPAAVHPVPFGEASLEGDLLRVTLPPRSVVVLELR